MIYCIIPARKGSKRLKGKNMFLLNGKPLIEYTIDEVLQSKHIPKENIFVNSDWDELLEFSSNKGIKTLKRPDYLGGDKIWTQDVIDHTISELGLKPDDIIVICQANSPQITSKVLDKCIEMLIENELWQVHTVGDDMINNGAIQIIKCFVSSHQGKVNYNGVVVTDWVDVHTLQDIKYLEK